MDKSTFHIERFTYEKHLVLVDPLTKLLHAAYAPLAAQGMKYVATHQSASKTLERLDEGEGYLAFLAGKLAGTVTLYKTDLKSSCLYYRKENVFSFGQFAIRLDLQGHGYGSKLMDHAENRAKEQGAKELALDTSEHANALIRTYEKRGYQHVGYTQWSDTNYRSVILSKKL